MVQGYEGGGAMGAIRMVQGYEGGGAIGAIPKAQGEQGVHCHGAMGAICRGAAVQSLRALPVRWCYT